MLQKKKKSAQQDKNYAIFKMSYMSIPKYLNFFTISMCFNLLYYCKNVQSTPKCKI